jgi:FkbM family methyltransferase
MDNELIFDIGMHMGQDTCYYLSKGYRVVAVDADARLIERARELFAHAVRTGRLTLVYCAVAANQGEVEFHLSEESVWSSLNKAISNRHHLFKATVRVPARRLADLLIEFGVPVYCKIDVEGYDAVCLATLEHTPELPRFISVETECLGDKELLTEAQALETLDRLHGLGYRRFKLVDQPSLAVLSPFFSAYWTRPSLWVRARKRLGLGGYRAPNYNLLISETRADLTRRHGWSFADGASGPFGDDLAGEWLEYAAARQTLLRHRREYHGMPDAKPYGFWCDWHATV